MKKILIIILTCICLSVILLIHELGHAYEMKKRGIEIKEIGLGLPISYIPNLSFKIPNSSIMFEVHALMITAYVEPTEKGQNNLKALSYTESTFIFGNGVWVGGVFGLAIILSLSLYKRDPKQKKKDMILFAILVGIIFLKDIVIMYIFPIIGIGLMGYMLYQLWKNGEIPTQHIVDVFNQFTSHNSWKTFLFYCGETSIGVSLVNLLPINPLDGGKIISKLIGEYMNPNYLVMFNHLSQVLLVFLIFFTFLKKKKE